MSAASTSSEARNTFTWRGAHTPGERRAEKRRRPAVARLRARHLVRCSDEHHLGGGGEGTPLADERRRLRRGGRHTRLAHLPAAREDARGYLLACGSAGGGSEEDTSGGREGLGTGSRVSAPHSELEYRLCLGYVSAMSRLCLRTVQLEQAARLRLLAARSLERLGRRDVVHALRRLALRAGQRRRRDRSLVVLALVGRAPNASGASAATLLPPLLLRPPLLPAVPLSLCLLLLPPLLLLLPPPLLLLRWRCHACRS